MQFKSAIGGQSIGLNFNFGGFVVAKMSKHDKAIFALGCKVGVRKKATARRRASARSRSSRYYY